MTQKEANENSLMEAEGGFLWISDMADDLVRGVLVETRASIIESI